MLLKPRVSETQRSRLLACPTLQAPTQLLLLHQYFAGELDSEHLADELLADVLARSPALEQERLALAAKEEERAREAAGITDSENRTEPLFVSVDELRQRPGKTGTTPDEASPTNSLNEA